VIDEQALVRALANKTIAGAGLDVYEREPLLAQGLAILKCRLIAPPGQCHHAYTRENG